VYPEPTLRLRSLRGSGQAGQAHRANICRVLQKTADANGAPPALRRKREFEEFLVGEPVMSDMNVRPPKEEERSLAPAKHTGERGFEGFVFWGGMYVGA